MRESNLLYLVFQKEVSIDGDFYYYTLDIANGLSLISNDSDEAEKEGWRVFLFNTDPVIEFTTKYYKYSDTDCRNECYSPVFHYSAIAG